MPSSAGVERRFQLFLTDGVRASIGTIVTPGPWDAPRRFVAVGPSRWVCNPNYIGALLVVFGEARLFLSLPLIVCAVFAVSLFSRQGLAALEPALLVTHRFAPSRCLLSKHPGKLAFEPYFSRALPSTVHVYSTTVVLFWNRASNSEGTAARLSDGSARRCWHSSDKGEAPTPAPLRVTYQIGWSAPTGALSLAAGAATETTAAYA